MAKLTVSDKLLISALRLEDRGNRPFSAEDLVVAAWQAFPDAFGLTGYGSDHPDSNRVFVEIMGSKPVRAQGYLMKVGAKRYQLTEAGRRRAEAADAQGSPAVAKADLTRGAARDLRRLLSSRAIQKLRDGRSDDITFYDACSFWGISPRSSRSDVDARLANFTATIEGGIVAVEQGAAGFQHNAPSFSRDDMASLERLHQMMLERFGSELEVLRRRGDERTA